MTGPFAELTQPDFQSGVQGLLPTGRAWPRAPDALLTSFLAARADALFRVHQSQVLLLTESDPAQTTLILPDWELDYGLPDPCTPPGATLQQRRMALLAKIGGQGGQSIAYFVSVAAALGVAITITEFRPFRSSVNASQDRADQADADFLWQVAAPSINVIPFRSSVSASGENLRMIDDTSLACRLTALKPAHTDLLFTYGGGTELAYAGVLGGFVLGSSILG